MKTSSTNVNFIRFPDIEFCYFFRTSLILMESIAALLLYKLTSSAIVSLDWKLRNRLNKIMSNTVGLLSFFCNFCYFLQHGLFFKQIDSYIINSCAELVFLVMYIEIQETPYLINKRKSIILLKSFVLNPQVYYQRISLSLLSLGFETQKNCRLKLFPPCSGIF